MIIFCDVVLSNKQAKREKSYFGFRLLRSSVSFGVLKSVNFF